MRATKNTPGWNYGKPKTVDTLDKLHEKYLNREIDGNQYKSALKQLLVEAEMYGRTDELNKMPVGENNSNYFTLRTHIINRLEELK